MLCGSRLRKSYCLQWQPRCRNSGDTLKRGRTNGKVTLAFGRHVRQAFYLINNALRVRSHKKLRAWIFEVLLSQIRKQNVDWPSRSWVKRSRITEIIKILSKKITIGGLFTLGHWERDVAIGRAWETPATSSCKAAILTGDVPCLNYASPCHMCQDWLFSICST